MFVVADSLTKLSDKDYTLSLTNLCLKEILHQYNGNKWIAYENDYSNHQAI